MAKTRKLTKAKLDRLWSKIVRTGITKCMMCGEPHKMLNAHHLISRRITAFRWDLNNFAVLCPGCHKWRTNSVHTSPWYLDITLMANYPDKWKWFTAHRFHLDEPFVLTLEEVYKNLKEVEANGK